MKFRPAHTPQSWRGIRAAAILSLLLFTFLIVACGGKNGTGTVTGQVVDVQSDGIDAIASLAIRDENGREWAFGGGRFLPFTPSHLIEHQALGEKVRVRYKEQPGGGLQIVSIEDG